MTAPASRSTPSISSLVSDARQPGMDSILSSVPPVCPRPRPDSCGTATPHAATNGASGNVILSPTPPVECLSAVGRDSLPKSIRSPDAIIAAVQRAISRRFIPFSRIAIASADTSPHSAHNVNPYDAFSTLHPATIRPSSTYAAAPTANPEYGAYARCIISRATARNAAQSTSLGDVGLTIGLRCSDSAHQTD